MTQKVAVIFFGITRSLSLTLPSIRANVLDAIPGDADVEVYSHFFLQKEIRGTRSGENGVMNLDEHRLLPSDWLELEEPDACLERWDFEALKRYGDGWHDEFRSLRNLVHQLHSLNQATSAALAGGAQVALFCRPDLRYHDSLAQPVAQALRADQPLMLIPFWAKHGGCNDRFAICAGTAAIAAYGQRIRQAQAFCETLGQPLHSEKLVKFAASQADISVRDIPARATRVRLDGSEVREAFTVSLGERVTRKLAFWRRRVRRALKAA